MLDDDTDDDEDTPSDDHVQIMEEISVAVPQDVQRQGEQTVEAEVPVSQVETIDKHSQTKTQKDESYSKSGVIKKI